MIQNAETPRRVSGAFPKDQQGGGSAATVAQQNRPRVAGRLDAYRSRGTGHWHRQVKVAKCPGCGHPHLHRAPMPLVPTLRKTGACGTPYLVVLNRGRAERGGT